MVHAAWDNTPGVLRVGLVGTLGKFGGILDTAGIVASGAAVLRSVRRSDVDLDPGDTEAATGCY